MQIDADAVRATRTEIINSQPIALRIQVCLSFGLVKLPKHFRLFVRNRDRQRRRRRRGTRCPYPQHIRPGNRVSIQRCQHVSDPVSGERDVRDNANGAFNPAVGADAIAADAVGLVPRAV